MNDATRIDEIASTTCSSTQEVSQDLNKAGLVAVNLIQNGSRPVLCLVCISERLVHVWKLLVEATAPPPTRSTCQYHIATQWVQYELYLWYETLGSYRYYLVIPQTLYSVLSTKLDFSRLTIHNFLPMLHCNTTAPVQIIYLWNGTYAKTYLRMELLNRLLGTCGTTGTWGTTGTRGTWGTTGTRELEEPREPKEPQEPGEPEEPREPEEPQEP